MENTNRFGRKNPSTSAVARNSGLVRGSRTHNTLITRGQFIRTAGVVGGAVAAAGLGLGGVAHAASTTQYWPGPNGPTDPNWTLQDAINSAGECGTIIIKAGDWGLPPGPNKNMSYKLLDGQMITGEGFNHDGKPVSKLRFMGPYPAYPSLSVGLWVGTNCTVSGLYFDYNTSLPIRGGFVGPVVVFGDIGEQPVTNARIADNYLENFPNYNIYMANCNNSSAENNYITNFYRFAITLAPVPATIIGANNNRIMKNTIVHSKTHPTAAQDSILLQYSSGNLFSQNMISEISGAGRIRSGIWIDLNSSNNQFLNNDLSGLLTPNTAQISIRSNSNGNYFANNSVGPVAPPNRISPFAGIEIQTSGNNIVNTTFYGAYPGWSASNVGYAYLSASSSINMVAAIKAGDPTPYPPFGFGLCGQVRDAGTDNKIPGYEKCDRAWDSIIQAFENRIAQEPPKDLEQY